MIIHNTATCDKCHQQIVSNTRIPKSTCECGNLTVGGGYATIYRSTEDISNYTNEVFEFPDFLYQRLMSAVEYSCDGLRKDPEGLMSAINAVLRILWYDGKLEDTPCGKIIARNDRLDEIMVTEPNGKTERYKKVVE